MKMNKKVIDNIIELVYYLKYNKRSGNTTLNIIGALNYKKPFAIICGMNMMQVQNYKNTLKSLGRTDFKNIKFISLNTIKNLKGSKLPLSIDPMILSNCILILNDWYETKNNILEKQYSEKIIENNKLKINLNEVNNEYRFLLEKYTSLEIENDKLKNIINKHTLDTKKLNLYTDLIKRVKKMTWLQRIFIIPGLFKNY